MHLHHYTLLDINLTRFVILSISVISILFFVQNMNLQVFATLGSFMIYSDVYTGGGNTSMPESVINNLNNLVETVSNIKENGSD